jgi:hypothetical protein
LSVATRPLGYVALIVTPGNRLGVDHLRSLVELRLRMQNHQSALRIAVIEGVIHLPDSLYVLFCDTVYSASPTASRAASGE